MFRDEMKLHLSATECVTDLYLGREMIIEPILTTFEGSVIF